MNITNPSVGEVANKTIDQRIAQVDVCFEADEEKISLLWMVHSRDARKSGFIGDGTGEQAVRTFDFDIDRQGNTYQIGTIADRPVTLDITYATVNGVRVAFYCSNSQAVDHLIIESWMKNHCPKFRAAPAPFQNAILDAVEAKNTRGLSGLRVP